MEKNTMKVNGAHQLFRYKHSSKYLPLCSAEELHTGRVNDYKNDDIFG